MQVPNLYAASSKKSRIRPRECTLRQPNRGPDRKIFRKLRVRAGSILALSCFVMSLVHSTWIDHVFDDAHNLEYGGLLEVVSFITLVVLIALAGLSVAAVTILYAL